MTSLVTGANRGIGLEMAKLLATRGPTIGTARAPKHAPDAPFRWEALDAADTASVDSLAARLDGTALSLLVCNAGVYLDKGHSLDTGYGADLWSQTFATNVTGVFLSVQRLLPNLRATPGAKVAIISSQMASSERAAGASYIYRASKAAALNLGRNLAADLRADGIAVGIYHPGWVQTDMGGSAADLTPETSAAGLIDRFDDLSMASTGCFLTWDGRPHPY